MTRTWADIVVPQQDTTYAAFADRADVLETGMLVAASPPQHEQHDDTAVQGRVISPSDTGELKEQVQTYRSETQFLIVSGTEPGITRAAFDDARIDVVMSPDKGRSDAGVDHVMMKLAAEHNVAVGIELSRLFGAQGKTRAHLLSHFRKQVRLAQRRGAPVIVCSGAQRPVQMRSPRDMAAFPRLWGMNEQASFDTASTNITDRVDRSHRIQDGNDVRPGVTEVDRDE